MPELTWEEILARFAASRNWWVATTGPRGPHTVPVWGVVADGALCFYGDPTTVRSRNLAADPRLVVHLETGDAPMIVHGRAHDAGPATGNPSVVKAFRAAYTEPGDAQYLPDEPAMEDPTIYVVRPERAMTWDPEGFETTQRRWRASG